MNESPDGHRELYRRAREAVVLVERGDRGMIELSGTDRAAWLNNLVTNVVKTLAAGDGAYAFATNVKGRTVFDLNVLMLDAPAAADGRTWLDIDAGWIDTARAHLNRYIITEDARLENVTPRIGRFALMGPSTAALAARLELGNLTPMAQLQHANAGGAGQATLRMVRHDFAGLFGAEFIGPPDAVATLRARAERAGAEFGLGLIDAAVVDVLRIESGIPASRRDIDSDVIPPETLQVERGISYHKGCYLGQEVIERMRSHGILSKQLVGVRLDGAGVALPPMTLMRDGQEIGRLTSACHSFALNAGLALGYVKSAHARPGVRVTATRDGAELAGEIVKLPVVS